MKVVTIVYVTDMDVSLAWYRRMLPEAELVSASPFWSELSLGSASLALHSTSQIEAGSQLGLALTADRPLEEIRSELAAREITLYREIADEPFGRSMVIRDPDALGIQINEHNPDRYPAEDG